MYKPEAAQFFSHAGAFVRDMMAPNRDAHAVKLVNQFVDNVV